MYVVTSRRKGARGMKVSVAAASRERDETRWRRRGTVRGEGWSDSVPSDISMRG